MSENMNISKSLSRLDELCSSGYAIALHINYTTPRFLFQTYAKEWREIYSERGLVLKDPTVLWGFGNTGMTLWSDLETLDEDGVLAMARDYGLNYGFVYSVDQGTSKSITSFARADRDFSSEEIDEISNIVQSLHDQTADVDEISLQDRDELRNMSIEFTRG